MTLKELHAELERVAGIYGWNLDMTLYDVWGNAIYSLADLEWYRESVGELGIAAHLRHPNSGRKGR